MKTQSTSVQSAQPAILSRLLAHAGLLTCALASAPAMAVDFTTDQGVQVKANATVSFGTSYRAEDQDPGLLGNVSAARVPGTPPGQLSGNAGSSDLNFSKGAPVSTVLKGMGDVEFRKGGFGVFVRAKFWRDVALAEQARPYGNTPNRFAANAPLSDNGFAAEARFSNTQIVDAYAFGEFDVGAQSPLGVKLGKQFLNWGGARMVAGGINVINPLNLPGAYRPGATPEESKLPVGMLSAQLQNSKAWGLEGFVQYEQVNVVLAGCGTFNGVPNYAPVGCNYVSVLPTAADPTALANGRYAHRAPDVNASDAGQYGLSLRISPEALKTDFRLFAMNYHSRMPSIRVTNANVGGGYGVFPGGTFSRLTDANGLKYAMLYPENTQLMGLSFDSKPAPGTQVFGEVAYRPNQPINLNASDLIAAFLTRSPVSALNLAKATNAIPAGGTFDGYDRFAVTTLSLGGTQVFPKQLGAERVVLTAEMGASSVASLPDVGTLRYGRSDDFGAAALTGQACTDPTVSKVACPQDGFVTASAWGYRARVAATYAVPALGAKLTPSLFYAQDVRGYAYDGTFLEGRRTVRSALRADWGKQYFAEVQYNAISGGTYNNQSDRDTYAAFVGMNF